MMDADKLKIAEDKCNEFIAKKVACLRAEKEMLSLLDGLPEDAKLTVNRFRVDELRFLLQK